MFEEICLTCGKHLKDDGSAYCSDECQSLDATSPSISSAASASSSAVPSPHLDYAVGGEVPALVPSALGFALRTYGHRHSVSSSSASSTSWSVLTDEDEDDPNFGVGSDHSFQEDAFHEAHSKSPGYFMNINNPLSYARRPSGTNNKSTVPHLHRRTSSGSFSGRVHSALSASSSTEDDIQSDSVLECDTYFDQSFLPGQSAPDRPSMAYDSDKGKEPSTITQKTKRARNRASLPTYFSLLQMPSSSDAIRSSPRSGQTAALVRPSPPTPKLSLTGLATRPSFTAPPTASIDATPRGRRRDIGEAIESHLASKYACRPEESPSRSTSRTRQRQTTLTNKLPPTFRDSPVARSSLSSKNSAEQVFDWSSVPQISPARGRAAVRRNSSPPPKVMRSLLGLGFGCERSVSPGICQSDGNKTRGRARVEELDGIGGTIDAPGFGHGRSGLLHREKRRSGRYFRS